MSITATSLGHPRTQWELEAALFRAIEYGAAIALSSSGKEIVSVIHDRDAIPAFSFYRNQKNVTAETLKALRSMAC